MKVLVAQSCPTLCDPRNYSLAGSSVHGIFWAKILELPFPSPGSLPDQGNQTPGFLHCRQILCHLSHQGSLPDTVGSWKMKMWFLLKKSEDLRDRRSGSYSWHCPQARYETMGAITVSQSLCISHGRNYQQTPSQMGLQGSDQIRWCKREPGVVAAWQSMGSHRVRHDWVTEHTNGLMDSNCMYVVLRGAFEVRFGHKNAMTMLYRYVLCSGSIWKL